MPSAPPPVKKWEFVTGKPDYRMRNFPQAPAIGDDGTIYAGASRGVFALNPDGSKKWFHQAVYEAVNNSVVFVVLDDSGNIWYDETGTVTGAVVRLAPDGSSGNDAIARAMVTQIGMGFDSTIFMGTQQAMVAIDHSQGIAQVKWTRLGSSFALAPDNSVFSLVGNALAHYSSKGDLVWISNLPVSCNAPALGSDNTIYLGCYGKVLAFNSDSTAKWSLESPSRSGSPAVAQDGTLYLACQDVDVCAVSSDGRLKWSFVTGGSVHSIPAIARSGNIYFGSSDHKLYALDANGKKRWEFQMQGDVFSPTISDDGTIYVQSEDAKLYAIRDNEANGGLLGQWPKVAGGLRNTARGGSLPVK
ncbi:MAG TPA: PQQ-binding-like beta-propeller repeat protein, partial [Candidatus Acidoferrales bacterium]|nr:PQQ-binding-like beta-propeller repeat protein [Candidatus Acidoferrales bacterium]